MKKFYPFMLFAAVLFAACNNQSQEAETAEEESLAEPEAVAVEPQASVAEVWATDAVLETPESVLYAPEQDILFVSNIVGDPSGLDGKGYISKLSLEGEVIEREWVTGLDAPKGMGIMDGKLYVTDVDDLVAISLETGEITDRYTVEGAKFLNDVVVADDKILFTDMEDNKIYALQDGQVQVWEEEGLNGPNGLAYNDGKVLVASNTLQVVSPEGVGEVLAEGLDAGDGIAVVDEDSYLVSNWRGEVFYVSAGNEKVKLIDTKDQNINTADIEYVKERNLLLVPTFSDNRVVAYELEVEE